MTQYNNTKKNVQFFAQLSGMPEVVVDAIIACEGQATPNPTNPFNIRYYGSDRLQIGHNPDGFGIYFTPEDGMRDAWGTLHLPFYSGVRAAIATHDPYKIARAWENSPWASGHYGSDGTTPGCIAKKVLAAATRTYKSKIAKFPKLRKWIVVAGTTLKGYDPKLPGAAIIEKTFEKASGATADAEIWVTWNGKKPFPVPHGGPFLRVTSGLFKGKLIVESMVTVNE